MYKAAQCCLKDIGSPAAKQTVRESYGIAACGHSFHRVKTVWPAWLHTFKASAQRVASAFSLVAGIASLVSFATEGTTVPRTLLIACLDEVPMQCLTHSSVSCFTLGLLCPNAAVHQSQHDISVNHKSLNLLNNFEHTHAGKSPWHGVFQTEA